MMNCTMPNMILVLGILFMVFGEGAILAECMFDYFGEEPPGMKMKPFNPSLPGLTGEFDSLIFTPDGNECYFKLKTDDVSKVYLRRMKDGIWSGPVPVTFPDGSKSIQGFSPNGNRLYFRTGRGHKFEKGGVYVRTRMEEGWSDARRLPEPVNDKAGAKEFIVVDLAVGAHEDIYFCSWRKPGKGKCDLWCAKYVDGIFPKAENLTHLNTPSSECMVMLGPNDSCLVFYSWRSGGYGKADLYVSFPTEAGRWSLPKNLGPRVNTKEGEVPMKFSPDGRYMFFYHAGKPHWIATRAVIPEIISNCSREEK